MIQILSFLLSLDTRQQSSQQVETERVEVEDTGMPMENLNDREIGVASYI